MVEDNASDSAEPAGKDQSRAVRTLTALGALGVTFALWQVSDLSCLLYPFRLFVTLIHEMGHSLAAVLTGGSMVSLQVMSNGAGLAVTTGGSKFVVYQAGYLGAALFGGALLLLANRLKDPRPLTALIGVFCGGVAFGWGEDETTRFLGAATAALFVALAYWGAPWVNSFALNLLAMMVSLNALMDIKVLLDSPAARLGDIPNDARQMQELTGIPTVVWVILWIVLSVLVLGTSVYLAFARRRKGQRNGSTN